MAVFKELSDIKRMEDPEERHAQDIKRGDGTFGKPVKVKETSVTINKYHQTMRFVGFIVGLIVFIVAVYFIYLGVMSFIPEKR